MGASHGSSRAVTGRVAASDGLQPDLIPLFENPAEWR